MKKARESETKPHLGEKSKGKEPLIGKGGTDDKKITDFRTGKPTSYAVKRGMNLTGAMVVCYDGERVDVFVKIRGIGACRVCTFEC